MPLFEMSPNIQEPENGTRKRSHEEFAEGAVELAMTDDKPSLTPMCLTGDSLLPPADAAASHLTPRGSPALSEAAGSTPARNSSSPPTPKKDEASKPAVKGSILQKLANQNPSSQSTQPQGQQPAKKKRAAVSAEDKEAREKEAAQKKEAREKEAAEKKEAREKEAAEKKRERDEKLAAKAAEKAEAEKIRAEKAKEREDKKRQKEEEQKRIQEEKDEKKRKKEEEQKRIQEEKDKKARSQPKIANFFGLPSTPKKSAAKAESVGEASPDKPASKQTTSEYEKLFKPFYIKEHTSLAPLGPPMDDETRDAKSRILDECIDGKRATEIEGSRFDAGQLFAFPGKRQARGRVHRPVKHIMEEVYRDTEKADGMGPDYANQIMKRARKQLSVIPIKVVAFSRDVRPPYYGTATLKPFAMGKEKMSQLARKPIGRHLPLQYDYDSEAEWQEEEEGEDLDMEDDEEEMDDEDDMEEFLDDSEDAGLSRRIFANTMEPDCTGICFEDEKRVGPVASVYEHRLEIMHDGMEQSWGIDPFSTKYWEPEQPKNKSTKNAAATEAGAKGSNMPPPPAPANAFAALTGGAPPGETPKLVKIELMDEVKKAILDNAALSKVGIVDYIFHQFRDSVSRTEVKNTLEYVAEKKGSGRQKEWALKPGHEIAS